MLDNATRRQLLERHKASGFPGSIIDVYNAYNQGIDLISQFEMSSQPQMQVANTPQQQQEGLRPFHQQGQTNQSMTFPNVPPNTNFNTVGMKAPINIKKIDNQGNLVKSYENVPPGIQSLPTGPVGGTVIETPANMQTGGVRKYQAGDFIYGDWREVSREVDPTTRDIIITEERDGSRTTGYNRKGVNWEEGYANWVAKGNVGTLEDFKRKAEKWKSSKTQTEYDRQNRTQRIKSEEENNRLPAFLPIPTLPPTSIPTSTYEKSPYNNTNPGGRGPYGSYRPLEMLGGDGRGSSLTLRQPNETIIEDDPNGVGQPLSPSYVQSTYDLNSKSRTNRRGNTKTKSVYSEDINVTRADGTSSRTRSRQVNKIKPGEVDRTRGKSVFEEFDADGNRIVRQVDRLRKTGGVRKYQSGDVIRPENDPWEYKYENGKYLAKKKENKEWIVARGNALEAIKTKIYGLPSSRSNQPTPKQPPKSSAPSGPVVPMFIHPSFGSSQPPKQSPATQSSKPPIREVSRRKPIEGMDYTAVRDNTSIPTIGLRPERMQLPTYDEMGRPIALRQEMERRAQQTPAQLRPAPPNYAPSPESEEPGYLEQISSELSSGITEATAWGRDMLSAFDRLQGKYGDADPEQLLNVPKDAIQIPQVESEAQPIKETYTELGTSPDRDGRQLSSFIHSFDNETGGTFRIGPKVLELYDMDTGKKRANAQTAIPGVAVAHFFRDSDISPNQKYTPKNWKIRSGYQFQNFSDDKVLPYGERETSDPERYRMMYRQNEDGTYSVKYKRAKNIGESDEGWSYDLPVSGQHRFSDIDWDREGPHTGWKNTSHYVPLKPGAQNIASLDMDRTGIPVRRGAPDEYSRFSGGSIVLLFTDPKTGREIGIDVAGSKNVLRDTGRKLIKEYGLREEDVTVVYHDMGSYSAKPRGKDGKLDYDQWFDFNTYNRGYSGAPLIIANQQSGGLRQNKSKYGKLLRSGGVRNKVPYYNKLKN